MKSSQTISVAFFMLATVVQFQAFAQEDRQPIGQLGSPTVSTIALDAPYTQEISDLVRQGLAAAAKISPDLHVDNKSALLINDGGTLTLGLSLIPDSGVTGTSLVEFLLLSSKGEVIHATMNSNGRSGQLRNMVIKDLDGNGVEFNSTERKMYRISAKRNASDATAQVANAGTVACIKQGLADAFKPCEASILLNSVAACVALLAATPETAGLSALFSVAPCSAAAGIIVQALACAGVDCQINLGGPPPAISDVNPKNIPVGQNVLLTIDGQNFQPNFSARVMIGGQSFPIYPGSQTVFVNSNRVLLWVLVGGSASTTYGVQIVNPDNQASNTYSGLIASGGQQGGNQGNAEVQISFSPNPAGASSTSDCSRAYFFTVTVKNVGGNAVTFNSLDVDNFQNLPFSQVGFQSQLGPGSQFQSGIRYCRGAGGSSVWTLHSTAGAAWSGTIQLQ